MHDEEDEEESMRSGRGSNENIAALSALPPSTERLDRCDATTQYNISDLYTQQPVMNCCRSLVRAYDDEGGGGGGGDDAVRPLTIPPTSTEGPQYRDEAPSTTQRGAQPHLSAVNK
jgi:hypothetical protein